MNINITLRISIFGWDIELASSNKWERYNRRENPINGFRKKLNYGKTIYVNVGPVRMGKEVLSELGKLAMKMSDYGFKQSFGDFIYEAIAFEEEEELVILEKAYELGGFDGLKNPTVCCHHITMAIGNPNGWRHSFREITLTHIGRIPGRVSAFRVLGAVDSCNALPHITIGVAEGASAREAGDITEWVPLENPIPLQGREHVFGD
jgi:hypothetical protein